MVDSFPKGFPSIVRTSRSPGGVNWAGVVDCFFPLSAVVGSPVYGSQLGSFAGLPFCPPASLRVTKFAAAAAT
jgi:hypothetical protein